MVVLLSNLCFKKYGLLLLGLLFIVIFSGCFSIKSPLDEHGPAIHPVRPETVLGKIARPDQTILRATANIEVHDGPGRYSTKAAILIKRPSFMRVEAIPLIGPVNFFLSIHEDVLKIFFPQKGIFYIGEATPENLVNTVNFLPVGLRIEDLLSIMLGTHPRVSEKNVSVAGSVEGQLYRVDIISEGRRLQSMWVDLSNHHLVEVRVFKDSGSTSYTARFEEFDTSGSPAIPMKVTLVSEIANNYSSKVIIRYSDIQFVTDIEALTFDLQLPPGIKPVYLDRKSP
jgi:hypothetical protein